MKLFGGKHRWAARRTPPGVHLAPKEKSASGQMQCSTLYSALGLILLSCALFVGTTFAWFSDQSTGATAQIMGGKLSMTLEFVDPVFSESDFDNIPMTRNTHSNSKSPENVWNRGETFESPLIHVVNTGDLPLEYKLIVIPATELQGVIDFSIEYDSTAVSPPDADNIQKLAAADPEPVEGTAFKLVGTMSDDAPMSACGAAIEKPFRLIVLARQSDVPDTVAWPDYCTDDFHNALKETFDYPDISGITVSHDPDMPCRLICACSDCGEVLEDDRVDSQTHTDQAKARFDALEVGAGFDKGDLEGSGNTYFKYLKCDYCNETIGTLTVTTGTPAGSEPTEIITSVRFDFTDTSVDGLYKKSAAQP